MIYFFYWLSIFGEAGPRPRSSVLPVFPGGQNWHFTLGRAHRLAGPASRDARGLSWMISAIFNFYMSSTSPGIPRRLPGPFSTDVKRGRMSDIMGGCMPFGVS